MRAPPLAPRRTRAGFTLAEVLLTLVIMGMILLTVTKVLTVARSSRDTIHNIEEQQLAGPAILQLLLSDLRALTVYDRDPRNVLRIKNRVISGFEGDSIDFACTTNGLIPYRENEGQVFRRADINEVGYRLRPNPESEDFLELYRREDFGVDDEPFEGGQFSLLHDRVKAFEIRVFPEDGPDVDPEEAWGTDGDEFTGLPARIEIELTLELAPRLVREALVPMRNTVTYRAIYRFPAALAKLLDTGLAPIIPRIEKPVTPAPGTPGAPGSGASELQTQSKGRSR